MREILKILNKRQSPPPIDQCREMHLCSFDHYYQTVLMSLGLKHIFSDNEPCNFIANEPTMHRTNNNQEATPDAIFQCDNNAKGVVCEIKTSLSTSEENLLRDLKPQIEKYSDIKNGWKTKTKTINDYAILLLIPKTNSTNLKNYLPSWLRDERINTNKKICVADWESVQQFQNNNEETTKINYCAGTTGCNFFDQRLKKGIQLNESNTFLEYERTKFVKSEPPELYVLTMLYQHIFPSISADFNEFEVTVEDIMRFVMDYYVGFSDEDSNRSQIRKKWIIRAMDILCTTKLSRKLADQPGKYIVRWPPQRQKNIKEYLLTKLCKNTKKRNIIDPKQSKLQ